MDPADHTAVESADPDACPATGPDSGADPSASDGPLDGNPSNRITAAGHPGDGTEEAVGGPHRRSAIGSRSDGKQEEGDNPGRWWRGWKDEGAMNPRKIVNALIWSAILGAAVVYGSDALNRLRKAAAGALP